MNFLGRELSNLKEGISKMPHLLSFHLSFTDDHVVPLITMPHADTLKTVKEGFKKQLESLEPKNELVN